jgi:UDP:flavonoid glycosyltransferase YjiC (YdhE family)
VDHHGGVGSTMTSVLCGVPQLILPRTVDQPANAARAVAAGVALSLDPTEVDLAAITRDCARLLTEASYAENAGKITAENLARPTPAEVADRVTRFIAGA